MPGAEYRTEPGCCAASSPCQEVDQFFSRESRFPQQGHQRALRHITIVLGNHCAAARRWMVVNVVAASCVVEDEAVLLKEANDLARFDSRKPWHHLLLYQLRIL